MTNLKEKKNIIFDLGNVVVDIDLNITIEGFRKLGFDENENFIGKYSQKGFFYDLEVGRISVEDFIKKVKDHIPRDVTSKQVIDCWKGMILDYQQDRIETILKLKETHQVFLLSNTNSIHIDACKDRVPLVGSLDKLFDKLYYSYEMGMSKPNTIIFDTVLKDANIKAEETLFLDDGALNVKAARTLGIESWLVEYPDQWVSKINALMQ
jgi:putative hydrolase of the HAD superfamily